MLPTVVLLALAVIPSLPPPPTGEGCAGQTLATCKGGWTGPMCDMQCQPGQPCDFRLYCHSWGATYGLSTAGTFLFPLDPSWSSWLVETKLRGFILAHGASLGLAPKLKWSHLGLAPHHRFRSDDGLLSQLKFDQSYRQIPVFGADAVVTIIATKRGAMGIRGAIVDAREEFEYVDAPSSQAQAEAGLLARVAEQLQVSPELLSLLDVRLVAFPRLKKIGWAAEVHRGWPSIGTAVIEADPTPVDEFPPLMYFDSATGQGLADETPIEVRADDPATDPADGIVEEVDRTTLYDGSDLMGSMNGPDFVLGTERVFVVEASGVASLMDLAPVPAFTSPTMQFLSSPGAPAFRAQNTFAIVSDMYARTDLIMAGKWDSGLGAKSLFPPDELVPRVAVWESAPGDTCEVLTKVEGSIYCAGGFIPGGDPDQLADEYESPLDGVLVDGKVTYEPIGFLALAGTGVTPALQTHEFGHIVDYFATSGVLDNGFGCTNCPGSCEVGKTDEVGSLMESWAQFASLWYFRELYAFGAQSSSCGILFDVSLGGNPAAHSEACRPGGEGFPVFLRPGDADCPDPSLCDRPGPEDANAKTGICLRNKGYRIDSFFNPLWELLHAETCAVEPPYVCTPLPTLGALPIGDVVGRALIFALRVNSATYKGFADDMGLYISCNHGPAAFADFNEVFCHHFLQECGQSAPMGCCGNGSRENGEDCDGDDLGGFACVDLGYDGGTLSCTDDCELNISQCMNDTPTSSDADTGIPTTSATATATGSATSTGTDGTGTGTDVESLTGDEGGDGGGCSCTAEDGGQNPGRWALAAGIMMLLRRSRRRVARAVALVSLPAVNACGPGTNGEESSGITEATSTSSTGPEPTSSTGTLPEAFRRFGSFHSESSMVGYQNAFDTLYAWATFELHADGTLTMMGYGCTSLTYTRDFTWEDAGGGAIRVVPDEVSPGGTFLWGADQVAGVTITPGEGCDDIMVFIDYTGESGKADLLHRYVPGELCAEGMACEFTFVWCDGKGPEACE